MDVLVIDGGTPSAVAAAQALRIDAVIFHSPAARKLVLDDPLILTPLFPDEEHLERLQVQLVEVPDRAPKRRQSWKDPWPGGRR